MSDVIARYQRYLMFIAFLVVTTSLMDRYVVSILMEQIKLDLGLSDAQLGWLVGPAFVITHVIFQLPLARLADRTVRRSLIAWAIALWSLFTIAAGFARTFPGLLVARMGVGITEAACAPPLASLLSDYFPQGQRGRAMSMLPLGGVAGVGAGMLLGGIVGQLYGWRVALIVAGIPGLFLALLARLTVREPLRGAQDQQAQRDNNTQAVPGTWNSIRCLWSIRTYRWMLVGASLSMVTSLGRGAWEPVFLMRVYELEQAKAGFMFFLISPLPSMFGAITGGLLVDRLTPRDPRWFMWMPALAIGTAVPLMLTFILLPADVRLPGSALQAGIVCSILGSIIAGMAAPATIAAAQSLAPVSVRATSHALWSMAANLVGMGIGPVCVGMLSEHFAPQYGQDSIRYALAIISLVAVPASIALFIGARSAGEDFRIRA